MRDLDQFPRGGLLIVWFSCQCGHSGDRCKVCKRDRKSAHYHNRAAIEDDTSVLFNSHHHHHFSSFCSPSQARKPTCNPLKIEIHQSKCRLQLAAIQNFTAVFINEHLQAYGHALMQWLHQPEQHHPVSQNKKTKNKLGSP